MTRFSGAPFFAALLAACSPSFGADDSGILDPEEWPRVFQIGESEIAIYMPQIREWDEFRHLKGTAAIGVKLDDASEASFGAVGIEADTVADFERDKVYVGKREFNNFRFPELDAVGAEKAEALVRSVLTPESPLEMPLAVVTAALEREGTTVADTAVSFDPPPIFYSDSPAILVTFIGEPRLEMADPANPGVLFAVNTNWDVLFDGGEYFLLGEN